MGTLPSPATNTSIRTARPSERLRAGRRLLETSNGDGKTGFASSVYPNGWAFGYPPSAKLTVVTGNFDGKDGLDFMFVSPSAYYTFLGNGNGTFTGSMH